MPQQGVLRESDSPAMLHEVHRAYLDISRAGALRNQHSYATCCMLLCPGVVVERYPLLHRNLAMDTLPTSTSQEVAMSAAGS